MCERASQETVQANPKAEAFNAGALRGREQVRPQTPLVLQVVVEVGLLEASQDSSNGPGPPPAGGRQMEGYLKVDQVWPAIIAHENVLPLVEIDVRDMARMQRPQNRSKLLEKAVGYRFAAPQRMSWDELPHQDVFSHERDQAGYTGNALSLLQNAVLTGFEVGARPGQRQRKKVARPPKFGDYLPAWTGVYASRGEEIMLESLAEPVLGAITRNYGR